MPDWREQFLAIDAEGHGRMTSFFIERKMKELRKIGFKRSQFSVDEPIADALLGMYKPDCSFSSPNTYFNAKKGNVLGKYICMIFLFRILRRIH